MSPMRPEIPQVWTVRDIITWGKEFFTNKGIDEARRNIELMVCAVLGTKRIELYTDHDRPLSKHELAELKAMVQRRVAREPLQYILGRADFYGHAYTVTPAVLIPRPETELIVERVSRLCASNPEHAYSCLDVGTGSGCIPISAILHTSNSRWTAIDVSPEALDVARLNASGLAVADRCAFAECDFLMQLPTGGPWEIVTMNPPYVAEQLMHELDPELSEYEPLQALTDHGDGLTFYRRMAEFCRNIVAPGGFVFLEIGHGQMMDVENIFQQKGHLTTTIADLAGIPRLVIVEVAR